MLQRVCVLSFSLAAFAPAAIIDVPGDQATIQRGIDAAEDGDIVLVAAGTYEEKIRFNGKAITVRGAGIDASVINPSAVSTGLARVVTFPYREGPDSVIEGFTLTGGKALRGGGIYSNASGGGGAALRASPAAAKRGISPRTSTSVGATDRGRKSHSNGPRIVNCKISGNSAEEVGGGIACWGFRGARITNCIIENNSSAQGGGVYGRWANVDIDDSIIRENSARSNPGLLGNQPLDTFVLGGGICLYQSEGYINNSRIENNKAEEGGGGIGQRSSHDLTITNCILSNNSARMDGGGIYSVSSTPWGSTLIANCTIQDNSCRTDGGGIFCLADAPRITNCIISSNTAGGNGGGIHCDFRARPKIINCTISENSADSTGGGIFCDGSDRPSVPTITNCILWDDLPNEVHGVSSDTMLTYCNVQGGHEGEGNIDASPRFATKLGYSFILSAGSRCIDAGTGAEDGLTWGAISANYGRRNGAEADMGAYGGPAAVGAIGGVHAMAVADSAGISAGNAGKTLGSPYLGKVPSEYEGEWERYAARLEEGSFLVLDLGGPVLVDKPGPDLYVEEVDAEDGFNNDPYKVAVSSDQITWTSLGDGYGDSVFDLRGRATDVRYIYIEGYAQDAEIEAISLFTPPS